MDEIQTKEKNDKNLEFVKYNMTATVFDKAADAFSNSLRQMLYSYTAINDYKLILGKYRTNVV